MSKRILITGAAGYIGHQLGNRLAKDFFVIGTDIRGRDDLDFPVQVMDIRDAGLVDLLKHEQITHVVHLASILQASKDRERDFDIDVNGTRNVLQACVEAGVQHLTVTSSGAAYGYYADNPSWIDEQDAIRGNREFAYSDHKRQIEELLARAQQGTSSEGVAGKVAAAFAAQLSSERIARWSGDMGQGVFGIDLYFACAYVAIQFFGGGTCRPASIRPTTAPAACPHVGQPVFLVG